MDQLSPWTGRTACALEAALRLSKEAFAEHVGIGVRTDPNVIAALDWLDEHAGREPGTARRQVASRLAQVDVRELHDRGNQRRRINRRQVAEALRDYYGSRVGRWR